MAVGWGSAPYVTEFDASGAVLADLRIGTSSDQKSYRSFRQAWPERPASSPALAVSGGPQPRTSAGTAPPRSRIGGLTPARDVLTCARSALRPRRGFETAINLGTSQGYVAVTFLDAHGYTLGHSSVVAV